MKLENISVYAKKYAFGGVYTLLAVENIYVLFLLFLDIYYSFADVNYWRENFSPFGYADSDYYPSLSVRLWGIFLFFCILFCSLYGSWLIFKKQKKIKGLFFMAVLFYLFLVMQYCEEYIMDWVWKDVDFP